MAMRIMARRFVAQLESSASMRSSMMRQTRLRSDKNILSEEEKAAENIYIRKREQEIKEKLARKSAGQAGTPPPVDGTPKTEASPNPPIGTPEGSYRNVAVVAGVIAAFASYWLLSGSKKKDEKDH
ncbi:hypothetical protein R1flu_015553 [Riccia fluitans]|uniref:Uncharacterized protein n=1 Tax=Riccia fluitans TaxID=41844 RepID=A0ABD1YME4_9MARC